MSAEPKTRKKNDEESERIKQQIVEAASRLFEQKGLYETSVSEIAEVAGISVPVTYHYVTRKSDILLLIMETFTDKFHGRVLPEIESIAEPAAKLTKAIEVYYRLVDEEMIKVVLVYRKARALDKNGRKKIMSDETAAARIFAEIIEDGQKKGVFRAFDPDLAAYNILSTGHMWALKNWHLKNTFDVTEYIRCQTEFLLSALRP